MSLCSVAENKIESERFLSNEYIVHTIVIRLLFHKFIGFVSNGNKMSNMKRIGEEWFVMVSRDELR